MRRPAEWQGSTSIAVAGRDIEQLTMALGALSSDCAGVVGEPGDAVLVVAGRQA